MSFESGWKGGSGLCLGERDFDLNVSTKTQWQQKEKIANSYDSCDGLMTNCLAVLQKNLIVLGNLSETK